MSVRRLPVYILADCSGSMAGHPIESVKIGIRTLHSNLLDDPASVEAAHLSVIAFDSGARQLAALKEIQQFTPPDLNASGQTALGAALKTLIDCINSEVRKTTAEQKGDWKPLVFLLTDGAPTDNWQPYADELKRSKLAEIVAVACGDAADTSVLQQLTDIDKVLVMKDTSEDAFKQFFKLVTWTVSQKAAKPDAPTTGVQLPPPPPAITIVP